jgi:uncharacterized protein (DUF1810 family)
MQHALQRFVAAQAPVYAQVVEELQRGRKVSHWMWFVFPQVAGLGSSPMSERYAISSLDEARAYLDHPLLGARLRECAGLLLATRAASADAVLGPIDARKLRSSMTLFQRADPGEPLFGDVLQRFYRGLPDPLTEAILATA